MEMTKDTMNDFLNTLPMVLYEYVLYNDESSEFLYMSPTVSKMLEHDESHFIADTMNFWEMVHPDDIYKLKTDDNTANKGNEFFKSEIRMNLPSGIQKWIEMSSRPTTRAKDGAIIWSGYIIDITSRKEIECERNNLIDSLQKAMAEINTLQGIIPICSYCHNIRDEDGAWDRMESYIHKHSDASFSHGICPNCGIKERQKAGLTIK